MRNSHIPAPAIAMSAPAYAARYAACVGILIPTGSRVEWQGRPGTVLSGNEPSEWVPAGTGMVSVEFDTTPRGATRYAELFTDEVRTLPALTVWEV